MLIFIIKQCSVYRNEAALAGSIRFKAAVDSQLGQASYFSVAD